MHATFMPTRMHRAVTYLVAPLLLNIVFFIVYLQIGIHVFDAATRVLAETERRLALQLLRLGGFAVPILYVLIRTRLLSRSISGHEVALLIFSAWLLAGTGDILRLMTANIISNLTAILHGVKIASFAIAALFGTAMVVQYCKRKILKERHLFLERSTILILFSVAYAAVALMVLAVHISNAQNQTGFYAGAAAVIAMLVALNIYGFILFRSFYASLGQRAFAVKSQQLPLGTPPSASAEKLQAAYAELFAVIELLGDKNQNRATLQSRLRQIGLELKRQSLAAERYAGQVLQQPRQTIRVIDHTRPARFLIIDSNSVSRRVLSEHLTPHSECRADTAESGKDGLHASLSLHYDVVFIGLDLSDMSGLEVARIIRENGSGAILVACADAGCALEPDALLAGFNRYVERPFDQHEIALHLESIFERR
ncbi:response regulator [Turneriella parva]|uniref:Response regulator receiver n=1 Tax=Turneriella parva (strain ATCC BAA-1111 / DSM 21527 / NCTC 11395 / H) TaxID=869212 RepID=I4B3B0_TURPD|nr:response regulator [Turneriella parva]AFM11767.1 response regulator receiver [Turneriella parva DSM 21527]